MGRINILDKSVAEKIAAGEVCERPSSVVKELVENSIDAKATSVTVEIAKGGTEYIRVTDNGSGIMREDTAAAFLRHATSKIKDEKDLEKIATLGFRGEALCSVAAVSRTELITKSVTEDVGTYMLVEGGETKKCESAGCPTGTTITVRNLFFNTPARMKFLKKDATEAGYVTDVCQRVALSHPEVSLRYIRDGKDIFFTPGDGDVKNTVRAVFGKDIANAMAPIDARDGFCHIEGLVGKNNLSRPNRNMQYFFVNGRAVKSSLLSAAMTEAYKNELMVGKFPVCVLNLEMPCDMVDVNVHPAKTEVKFASDEEVYRCLVPAVRDAVRRESWQKTVLREQSNAFKTAIEQPAVRQVDLKDRSVVVNTAAETKKMFSPSFAKAEKKPLFKSVEKSVKQTAQSAAELPEKRIESLNVREESAPFEKAETTSKNAQSEEKTPQESRTLEVKVPSFELVGQLFATYIIIQTENEMLMIDQHAAHERINYEKIKNAGAVKQMLMLPQSVNLTAREKAAWEENREFLESVGFETDNFGQDSIIVRAFPSDIDFADGEGLLIELINSFMGEEKGEISYLRDKAVYTVACKAAIKANKSLSEKEMHSLALEAMALEGISTCPHGRPISVKMTKYQIEKMFKRIV